MSGSTCWNSRPTWSPALTSCHTATGDLPDDEAVAVDVGHEEGLEVVLVEALLQHLGGHVPPGSHASARGQVHLIGVTDTRHKHRDP